MRSFETLSSGATSASSFSSSNMSLRDSTVSRVASQLRQLKLTLKDASSEASTAPPSAAVRSLSAYSPSVPSNLLSQDGGECPAQVPEVIPQNRSPGDVGQTPANVPTRSLFDGTGKNASKLLSNNVSGLHISLMRRLNCLHKCPLTGTYWFYDISVLCVSIPQVLTAVAETMPQPCKGFALHNQYVKALQPQDADADDDDAGLDEDARQPVKRKSQAARKTKGKKNGLRKLRKLKSKAAIHKAEVPQVEKAELPQAESAEIRDDSTVEYQPHLFNEKRNVFLESLKGTCSYKEACQRWARSFERAQMLASLPVQELKRRKFITKDVCENPFARVVAARGGA